MAIHASTGGEWVPIANPLGGAPLAEYRSDGSPGGTEARPIGVSIDSLTRADALAYNISIRMFDGEDVSDIIASYTAFNPPQTVVQTAAGPTPVSSLDPAQQAAYAANDALRAKQAADAIAILQSGKLQATTPAGGSSMLPPAAPTSSAAPPALPVITPSTAAEGAKIDLYGSAALPVIRTAGLGQSVAASTSSGATSAANGTTGSAPATAPSGATSVTGGSITASDLSSGPIISLFSGNNSTLTVVAVAAVVVVVLFFMFRGGAK